MGKIKKEIEEFIPVAKMNRIEKSNGTYSSFSVDKTIVGFTCERLWANNKPHVSCIEAKVYDLILTMYYPKKGAPYKCYEVQDVKGRTLIKIHKANWWHQLEGCIAPGLAVGMVKEERGVSSSGNAFDIFMLLMCDAKKGKLIITEDF